MRTAVLLTALSAGLLQAASGAALPHLERRQCAAINQIALVSVLCLNQSSRILGAESGLEGPNKLAAVTFLQFRDWSVQGWFTVDGCGTLSSCLTVRTWIDGGFPFQNTVEDIHNFMLGANSDAFSSVSSTAYIARLALAGSATNWNNVLAGSNDDAQVGSGSLENITLILTIYYSGSSSLCGRLLTTWGKTNLRCEQTRLLTCLKVLGARILHLTS